MLVINFKSSLETTNFYVFFNLLKKFRQANFRSNGQRGIIYEDFIYMRISIVGLGLLYKKAVIF